MFLGDFVFDFLHRDADIPAAFSERNFSRGRRGYFEFNKKGIVEIGKPVNLCNFCTLLCFAIEECVYSADCRSLATAGYSTPAKIEVNVLYLKEA